MEEGKRLWGHWQHPTKKKGAWVLESARPTFKPQLFFNDCDHEYLLIFPESQCPHLRNRNYRNHTERVLPSLKQKPASLLEPRTKWSLRTLKYRNIKTGYISCPVSYSLYFPVVSCCESMFFMDWSYEIILHFNIYQFKTSKPIHLRWARKVLN